MGWGTDDIIEDGWRTDDMIEDARPAVPGAVETTEQYEARRKHEINLWIEHKNRLTVAKDSELNLRNKVTATVFPEPKKGTNRVWLGDGYAIKLVHGWNYTLGDKDKQFGDGRKYPMAEQVMDLEATLVKEHGAAAEELLNGLIKWSAELSPTEYEKLDPSKPHHARAKELIDAILTVKPATPQLTFEEPKSA